MSLNLPIDMLEDVAACNLAVVKALLHLTVDHVPRPADIFAQESAQRSKQIGEVFNLPGAEVFAARARNSLRQIVIFFIRVVTADAQSGLAAGQTMTPSRPLDYDLRHVFTHKCPLIRLRPFGRSPKLSAPFAVAVEPWRIPPAVPRSAARAI